MNSGAEQLDPTIIRSVIEKGIGLLERRCIRLDGRDPNWRSLFVEELENITRTASRAEFEARVNAVISRGGLSHVAFFHETAQRPPAPVCHQCHVLSDRHTARQTLAVRGCARRGPGSCSWDSPWRCALERRWQSDRTARTAKRSALGTDAEVEIERADGFTHKVQVVLPKAEPGKAKAKRRWRSHQVSSRERSSQELAT